MLFFTMALVVSTGGYAIAEDTSSLVNPFSTEAAKKYNPRKFTADPKAKMPLFPALPKVETDNYSFGGIVQSMMLMTNTGVSNTLRPPVGGNFTMPVPKWNMELFGGVGGVFVPTSTSPYTKTNTWFSQTRTGARFALDPKQIFWLGGSGYYLTNFAHKTRQWGYSTADLTIRLGR